MAQKYFPPTYVKLKEPNDEASVNQAIDIVYKNLNALAVSAIVPLIQPLIVKVSSNTSYTIPNVVGFSKIMILSTFLVATAGGPFTFTLTTGKAGTSTIVIPVAAPPATPRNLLFDIYVDSLGNIISSYWQV